MKRLCLPVLLAFCLLLTGCGSKAAKKQFEKFSEELAGSAALSFTAQMRAEYEDKTVQFTLQYEKDETGCAVTVLAPELIAGVKARVAGGDTALEYDGMIIDTGTLDSYGLTPMSALPVLVQAMTAGHLDSYWQENGMTVMQLIPNDHLTATVWFEGGSLVPVRAELISEGRVTVSCDIESWTLS